MRLIGTMVFVVGLLRATANASPSAEDLYAEGQAAFDRGEFVMAIARWKSAYEQSRLPLLVFNLGQAYRLSGDCLNALSAFKQYVLLDPGAEQRSLADGFVAELSPRCGQRPDPRPAEQTEPQVQRHPGNGQNTKTAGFVTGGVGVAILATGLLFGGRAVSLGEQVTRDCATTCDWSIEKGKERDGKRYAAVGKVLDVVGVAAIAAGIGLYVYGVRKDEPRLTIQPQRAGATVSWSGRW